MTIVGWKLNSRDLLKLKTDVPPKYLPVVVPHCTLHLGNRFRLELPPLAAGRVYAKVDDGDGVEALLLTVNNQTHRPDGNFYHITWSLSENRKPRESNSVIEHFPHAKLTCVVEVQLIPSAL